MNTPILQLKDVSKHYPGVVALDQVKFILYPGEVHALVGENGAGKSTLIKAITGAIKISGGEILFEGKILEHNNPIKALQMGIAAVYQEFNLVPKMTVAENIFLGRFPRGRLGVDYARMYCEAQDILDELGVKVDVRTKVSRLTIGYQQLVEIAKAVSRNVKVLIMDEPSAPLTENEMHYLFGIVRKLKARGVAVIYISHRLEEIFDLCDSVTVFRDGHYIDTLPVRNTNIGQLIALMVNRPLGKEFPARQYTRGEKVLEVRNVYTLRLKNVSFDAYRGEILGFAGLVGSGRTEVARAVFGADRILKGEILVGKKKITLKTPRDAIRHGIGLIPEDRKQHGALLHLSVRHNITYPSLTNLFRKGNINNKLEAEIAGSQISALRIKTPTQTQLVRNLSGGNQQKVVLAKWLLKNSDILIFDEPTRGIDVGAKQEIYQMLCEMVEKGKVVIMISSELRELLGLADRIIVMHEGEIAGELKGAQISQEAVLTLASGFRKDAKNEEAET